MAFCTNCGTQVADGVKFCTSCGTAMGGSAADPATASVSGAGSADNIAGLGREMADQLKNAAKEQLNKLNPLKGLFGKK